MWKSIHLAYLTKQILWGFLQAAKLSRKSYPLEQYFERLVFTKDLVFDPPQYSEPRYTTTLSEDPISRCIAIQAFVWLSIFKGSTRQFMMKEVPSFL